MNKRRAMFRRLRDRMKKKKTTASSSRKARDTRKCGSCEACLLKEDCGNCRFCDVNTTYFHYCNCKLEVISAPYPCFRAEMYINNYSENVKIYID